MGPRFRTGAARSVSTLSLPACIPETESCIYHADLAAADDLARIGEVGGGYECLRGGLTDALEAEGEGQPWAETLCRLYREAIDSYLARHREGLRRL